MRAALRRHWRPLVGVTAVALAGGAGWLAYAALRPDPIADFLASHWQRPLPPQGAVPAGFSPLEASLDPASCGSCHTAQHADWSTSLHAQTMTAGVQWQLHLLPQGEANACLDCHAPLAEQKALVAQARGWANAPATLPPAHVPPTLGNQGLVCAACHVRAHERVGPPPREGAVPAGLAPHGGYTASPAFEDSRFCSSCHQFPDDGPRTNSKLREDTYRQWLASPQAARGETCQSCHMPDRRHQWQGIHAPEMVQKALTTTLELRGEEVIATLTNTGSAHHFPTYLVAKVTAQLVQLGATETVLAEQVIGWQVDVSLQNETFDTRLAAGESLTLKGTLPAGSRRAGEQVELRLLVAPREHYERSFASVLAQSASLQADTLKLLQQAHDEAIATRYALSLRSTRLAAR